MDTRQAVKGQPNATHTHTCCDERARPDSARPASGRRPASTATTRRCHLGAVWQQAARRHSVNNTRGQRASEDERAAEADGCGSEVGRGGAKGEVRLVAIAATADEATALWLSRVSGSWLRRPWYCAL